MNYSYGGKSIPPFLYQILLQSHVLIAGTTGSGKSVLENNLIKSLLALDNKTFIVLLDTKKVELFEYRKAKECLYYADDIKTCYNALIKTVMLIEKRLHDMRRNVLKEYAGKHLFVFIDEYADLVTQTKAIVPLVCRIAQIGRAARVHLILCTQRPTRDIITGQIKVNLDCKIALRTVSKQDSKNIIGCGGAELLPMFGKALIQLPSYRTIQSIDIPKL